MKNPGVENLEYFDLKESVFKYLVYWPYFLVSVIITFSSAYLSTRYISYTYNTNSRIEIIDKAQDNEMSLPTAMTIFNRSLVNLDNEIGVIKSYMLNSIVVSHLKSNVKYYSIGRIKTSQNHLSEWFDDFVIDFKINLDEVDSMSLFKIEISESGIMTIEEFSEYDVLISSSTFNNPNTYSTNHNLPFDIQINDLIESDVKKELLILPFNATTDDFIENLLVRPTAEDSDQLELILTRNNIKIAEEYLNELLFRFDQDGINDRRLEYKRTIDFVDKRSSFLEKELQEIEFKKENFKIQNNLTNIIADAEININQQFLYDSELFKNQSQKDLINLIEETIENDKGELLPVNFGLNDSDVNSLINNYNKFIFERDKLLSSAGPNNKYIISLDKQIDNAINNIKFSLKKYSNSLDLTIQNIESKEREFETKYSQLPSNEKILRSIERELEIKEALFLLLLQKREEAAINFAVIKPSIKIIDYARTNILTKSPSNFVIYLLAIMIGLIIPFIVITIIYFFDSKIQSRDDIINVLDLPLLSEIPNIKDYKLDDLNKVSSNSRNPFVESMRMLVTNLNFTLSNVKNTSNGKSILVTSSIKGEGKTIISVYLARVLSFLQKKVVIIGTDLRNPQLHKYIQKDKKNTGLSDYLYRDKLSLEDLIIKFDNLDIILSGTIPPNPAALLSSDKYTNLISELKKRYDYVIIDSAPCLLVADTLHYSENVDSSIIVTRCNHTPREIIDYLKNLTNTGKINNPSIVLNGVGANSLYNYKYSYRYGYKYGYNYGYGYGYNEDSN